MIEKHLQKLIKKFESTPGAALGTSFSSTSPITTPSATPNLNWINLL
jgi:hypothetical protein